jgi:hypothetical protein
MSYQERRAIVSFISTILISAIYSVYMVQRYPAGNLYSVDIFRFWGSFFLILIPVSILARIFIRILFNITNRIATKEKEPSIIDERDMLIGLKATRNAFYMFTFGFLLAMGALIIEMPPTSMFIILFCSGIVSEMVGDISQLYFYRRGI